MQLSKLGVIQTLPTSFTFFRAIFDAIPVARPFLSPFKRQGAALANLWFEAIFGLGVHDLILIQWTNSLRLTLFAEVRVDRRGQECEQG